MRFERCNSDSSIYKQPIGKDGIFLLIYVDYLVACKQEEKINRIERDKERAVPKLDDGGAQG